MEKRRSRRLAAGTALFILLLLAAMTGALASDYGMVSDTVNNMKVKLIYLLVVHLASLFQ